MDWANRVGIAQFSCLADWAKGEKGGGTNSLPLLERVQVRQIKLVLLPVCFLAGDNSILEQRAGRDSAQAWTHWLPETGVGLGLSPLLIVLVGFRLKHQSTGAWIWVELV